MGNSLNMELEGKWVVLEKRLFGEKYQSEMARTAKVTGGFGANAATSGTMLCVEFADGTSASYRGYDVEKLATFIPEVSGLKVIEVGDDISYHVGHSTFFFNIVVGFGKKQNNGNPVLYIRDNRLKSGKRLVHIKDIVSVYHDRT